jgi:hypothetical protein
MFAIGERFESGAPCVFAESELTRAGFQEETFGLFATKPA